MASHGCLKKRSLPVSLTQSQVLFWMHRCLTCFCDELHEKFTSHYQHLYSLFKYCHKSHGLFVHIAYMLHCHLKWTTHSNAVSTPIFFCAHPAPLLFSLNNSTRMKATYAISTFQSLPLNIQMLHRTTPTRPISIANHSSPWTDSHCCFYPISNTSETSPQT